ncbi:unnamed protein product [Closterium sp. NIES-54]
MPPKKQKPSTKGKEKADDDKPLEDPPYVQWMKEEQERGRNQGKIKHEHAPRRDGPGPSSARDDSADSSDGGDTDILSDELEEIVSSSGSDSDSDNSKAASGSDEDESASEPDASEAGPSNGKRKRSSKTKRQWTDEELTALAAAKWYTWEDLKQMRGKQGNQYWKKLRAHMKKSGTKWTRNSTAMQHAWKRMEAEYRDTLRNNVTSGRKPKRKKPWFEYVYLLKSIPANVKPHVVEGGGAGETHVHPQTPLQLDADMLEGGTTTPVTRGLQRAPRRAVAIDAPRHTYNLHFQQVSTSRPPPPPPPPPPFPATPSPIPARRSRVNETGTMAAAKVISDTLNACNGQAMRQLSDAVQLLIAAIHMAGAMWRPPPAPPLPATVPAPAQPPAIANDTGNLVNAPHVDRELADAPEEDEGASPDDMHSR